MEEEIQEMTSRNQEGTKNLLGDAKGHLLLQEEIVAALLGFRLC